MITVSPSTAQVVMGDLTGIAMGMLKTIPIWVSSASSFMSMVLRSMMVDWLSFLEVICFEIRKSMLSQILNSNQVGC